jgi:hypothetical protein
MVVPPGRRSGGEHAEGAGHAEMNEQRAGVRRVFPGHADQDELSAALDGLYQSADQLFRQRRGYRPAQRGVPYMNLVDPPALNVRPYAQTCDFYFRQFWHNGKPSHARVAAARYLRSTAA